MRFMYEVLDQVAQFKAPALLDSHAVPFGNQI